MIRTIIGLALTALLAGQALAANEPLTWVGCGITKKAFMAELAKAYERETGIKIDLEGGGASKGIRRTGDQTAHLGGTCRPRLPGHPDEAATQLNPVAWDALVVITHPDNPVENITLEQLRAVYEGRITNWRSLGGPDRPLELQIRTGKQSGVGRILRELVFANVDQDFVAAAVHASSGPLETAVEQNPNAIGVTGISSARKRQVNILELEGRAPDYNNIRSGDYLLYRPLYIAYNAANPRHVEVQRFIDFAHSRKGREVIRNQGAVPYLDALHLTRKQRTQWLQARDGGVTAAR